MRVDIRGDSYDLDAGLVAEDETEIRRQIDEYAAGDREAFDLTVDYPERHLGDVMRAMSEIPYGETRTYGDLAQDLDSGAVAVGQACGSNPLPIIVPCHRVVGSDGYGGFSAAGGVDAKRRLLAFERGEGLDRF
ncbi:methylated-DNA--[protein]-cysteine S-methyltransferase [Halolamina salifodinae]|uniref:Methylated-DNA-[protein]-cysteine S-methyltransferase n=1 Tax=Halolamina salifodinae TaxID=1202767 RepID=A0A8T4GS56_9EURY|nr:methylated-DNA--[protein]-cysteine S-methyltransferase [Halolamina salifodinae]MBP1985867.1 methylated-DNA-[protein]-cysteine S-methyltransferase [Halolamina salifodinae]